MSENDSIVMQQDNAKGSTALQAKIVNVYPNGITEEKCREICLSVYKDNIMSLQDEAKDIAYQLAERLTDMFIEKLSRQDDEIRKKIEDQLKEPAMQEAIFKSQKCYAMSNDEDHLKILTDMLIDRGSISQRTNKQMLIDEAIDVLPRLNQKHLDILAFYMSLNFSRSFYNKDITNAYINDLIQYIYCILPIKKDDSNLLYLFQKNCLIMSTGLVVKHGINQTLGKHIRILHSGFPKNDYDKLITVNISEIPFESSLIKPENVVINMTLEKLQSLLKEKNVDKENYDNIIHFWYRNDEENDLLLKDYIITNFKDGNLLFDNWQNLEHYHISILGMTIAQAYFKVKYNTVLKWDFD